jgi:hypothetical protein
MSVDGFDRSQIPVESIIMKTNNDSDDDAMLLGILKKDDSFGKDLDLDVMAIDRSSPVANDLDFGSDSQ